MDVVWTVFLFAFGACVGSFLNVVVYRMPRGMSIAWPGSHCPRCGVAIRWYDNIPIVSWLLLRARCRSCKGPISPRYLLIELLTAVLVAGLFVCLFLLDMRAGIDDFAGQWPAYVSYAALVCGLLACSVVDIELFIVPLPVMWFCAAVGIVAAGAFPGAFRADPAHPLMPAVSPAVAAAALAACLGVAVARLLVRLGVLQESFIDAEDRPLASPAEQADRIGPPLKALRELLYVVPAAAAAVATYWLITRSESFRAAMLVRFPYRTYGPMADRLVVVTGLLAAVVAATLCTWLMRMALRLILGERIAPARSGASREPQVAYTSAHGINPRLEILRETAFLAPSVLLAAGAYLLVTRVGAIGQAAAWLMDSQAGWRFAAHAETAAGAVFGMVLAAALVWGIRILGTLAFGKEAMGMGDVHILAAVGAVCGWAVATVTFFAAPLLGVVYVLHCAAAGRGRREIPYGPWLAAGTLWVLLFYDRIVAFLIPSG
ncbi:MAG TPA: A24 family peptidase [Phycisphaerae bacterium]|nr:A24 family peptidase [Phycisphaerae bacterium]